MMTHIPFLDLVILPAGKIRRRHKNWVYFDSGKREAEKEEEKEEEAFVANYICSTS
jgi:hypothetical protein